MTTAPGAARPTRGFWPMRDLPVVGWLLATVVIAFVHPFVPAPRWLLIHLLLLGAATHAILVWSRYFTDALLHTRPSPRDRPSQNRRLVLLDAGVLLVVGGVIGDAWPVTVAGASGVVAAVGWHGLGLFRQLRSALPSRFGPTVRYYVAAAGLLPIGVTIGAILAREPADPWHERLLVAHASINVLGWIGLTVVGTLLTLWPTMLRTRIASGAERASTRALPVLVAGIVLAAGGALVDLRVATTLGLVAYAVGLGLVALPWARAARTRPPASFATYSVAAGVAWLAGCLLALVAGFATAPSWAVAEARLTWFTPFLAAGFGAQVLLGALSYLVPVALGGGGGPVAAANAVLDRAAMLRVAAVNAGLLVCVSPVPAAVRVPCSTVVLVGLASFLPLLILAIRASHAVRRSTRPAPARGPGDRPVRRPAVLGVAIVLVVAGAGLVVDRGGVDLFGAAPSVAAGAEPTGHTTTVDVTAADMRFTPSTIDVPAGDRLVIRLANTDDEDVHDLVLDDGSDTGRLAPGDSTRLDVGVVGRDVDGWCSVIGHKQMGMTLRIRAVGAAPRAGHAEHGGPAAGGAVPMTSMDLTDSPGAGFTAHEATLPPVPAGRVHRRTFRVREVVREVAPGVTQKLWTFNGSAPGPTLHGRVGDVFEITLVNDATIGHSVDFHAGALAPDRPMRTIAPGERLVYRFRATRAGVWLYHCSSMPMSAHIANGLFGAVVIDPPGLAPVDRTYVLTQSELYLGTQGGEVDVDKLMAERPDLVVFNGYADQYDHRPLRARVGERVRVWVLDAGPNRATSFHVVGGQFDATYAEGAWLLRGGPGRARGRAGAQALALQPGQGGFVELTFPQPGHYPFVSHVMVDAERGAHGVFEVLRR